MPALAFCFSSLDHPPYGSTALPPTKTYLRQGHGSGLRDRREEGGKKERKQCVTYSQKSKDQNLAIADFYKCKVD